MEIKGKIIAAMPEASGVSKAGNPWKKREYVLETQETYPRKVFFSFFGDRADQYPLNVGDMITLSFDINSREYNGRWFVQIDGWKAERDTEAAPAPVPQAPAPDLGGYPAPPPMGGAPAAGGNNFEDLPF